MSTYDITYLIIGIIVVALVFLLWVVLFPIFVKKPTKNGLKYDWRYKESKTEEIKINSEHLNNISVGKEREE